jgi:hypothetical protein
LLAYNVAFVLPSLLLAVFWIALKRKSVPLITASLVAGLACAALVYGLNQWSLKSVAKEGRTEEYWGSKYALFYRANSGQSRARWTLSKAADVAAIIGLRRELWMGHEALGERLATRIGEADRVLWIALTLLGVAAVVRKNRLLALLLLLPLATLVAVNALGKWPFGQFRTNLFLCVYLFPLPLLAMDRAAQLLGWRRQLPLLGLVLLDVLGSWSLSFDLEGHKRIWGYDGSAREVLPVLYQLRKEELARHPNAKRARLVVDLFTAKPFEYYLRLHPQFSREYADFEQQFDIDKVSSNRIAEIAKWRLANSRRPVYAVAAKSSSFAALQRLAQSNVHVIAERRIAEKVLVVVLDD